MLFDGSVALAGFLIFVGTSKVVGGQNLSEFQSCCPYCRADEQLWTSTRGAWNLSLAEDVQVDLVNSPAFLLDEHRVVHEVAYGETYVVEYAGAPVEIQHESLVHAADILTDQYMELDLLESRTIAGVITQGGYVRDVREVALWLEESWTSVFMVSYGQKPDGPFRYVTNGVATAVFEANTDTYSHVVSTFASPVQARYIRIHPLQGRDRYDDSSSKVMIRATPIVCSAEPRCSIPRTNCHLSPWQPWGQCTCDEYMCSRRRARTVARHEACGGTRCDGMEERAECTPETPLWKKLALGLGCGLPGLLILLLVVVLPIKKHQRSKQPEVVFNRKRRQPDKPKGQQRSCDHPGDDKSIEMLDETKSTGEEDDDDDANEDLKAVGAFRTESSFRGKDKKSKGGKKTVTFGGQDQVKAIEEEESAADKPTVITTPRDVNVHERLHPNAGTTSKNEFRAKPGLGVPPARQGAALDANDSGQGNGGFDDEFTEFGF